MSDILEHYGTPRHSGRYPWGSGKNPQRSKNFITYVKEMKKEGLTETQIAKALIGPNANSSDLRAKMAIATNEYRKERIDRALKLREKGYGPSKIGEIMGEGESTVRNWLKSDAKEKKSSIHEVSDILKNQLKEKKYLDVGSGIELSLGITATKLKDAIALLKEEGYVTTNVQVDQQGTAEGMKTTIKVLGPPGTTYKEVNSHKDEIKAIEDYESDISKDNSRLGLPPVKSISSDRIKVVYAEDGGGDKDGVIELRRGLNDLNLGNANYAQVRIGVDGTHYLKGMAVYSDNMPPGVDVIFNTSKSNKKSLQEVLKPMKVDKTTGEISVDNPFGASIKPEERLKRVPRYYLDENGNKQVSPINVVYEEGDWSTWSKKLASQMLSKQPNTLVKNHLKLSYDIHKAEFDEICAVDNPVVKRKLLDEFQSKIDSVAVHLEAAALPRQASYVILPVNDLKENEIFAPRYNDGEKVALIRYPHAGTFEIPILTVNNHNKGARSIIGVDSPDAVGIHPKSAVKLSGADFDGDSVLVIPTGDKVKIKNSPQLKGLEGFDKQKDDIYTIEKDDPRYKTYPFIEKGSRKEGIEMGKISNLITDMTLKGASDEELARAVKHSMVVIDAAKHKLDYKQSEKDNDISELKKIYQAKADGSGGGVSTLISRSTSPIRIPRRDPDKSYNERGWDPETGEVHYVDKKGDTYIKKKKDKETGEYYSTGKVETRTDEVAWLSVEKDARKLISDYRTPNEIAYADYSNSLKALANEARKEYLATKVPKKDPSAAKAYAAEVASLNNKLNVALKNAPRERQAQLYAEQTMTAKKQEYYPNELSKEEKQKYRAQALAAGRAKFNAKKESVKFTEKEWEAVQARAISPSKLSTLLNNADMDSVKKLALPKHGTTLLPAQVATAKSMIARGYTQAEVADRLGVSASTISNAVNK